MNGVEILATEKVISETAFNWTGFWITGIVIIIIPLIFVILEFLSGEIEVAWGIFVVGIIFAAMAGYAFGKVTEEPIAYKNQYKVTVSDEVSMNEFNKRYEIIDQEGKIYTVEERGL